MKGLNIKNKVSVYIVVYLYYGPQGTATAISKYSDLGLHFEVGGVDFPHKLLCMPTLGGRGSGFAFFLVSVYAFMEFNRGFDEFTRVYYRDFQRMYRCVQFGLWP